MLALMLLTAILPMQAIAAPRPTGINLGSSNVTIDLAGAKTLQIVANVLPSGASQRMVWATSNKSIATVNSKGVVTAKKFGNVKIGVRPAGIKKWTTVKLSVKDSARPTSLSLPTTSITLTKGETYAIEPIYLPSSASTETSYATQKKAIATVSTGGVITAKAAGTTQIRVRSKRNSKLQKMLTVKVANPQAPTGITLLPENAPLEVGETVQLSASVTPETASSSVSYKSSNTSIATVSSTGLVTAKKIGSAKITVTSKANSGVKVVRSITVHDPNAPKSIHYLDSYQGALYFLDGDSVTLEYTVEPATARRDAVFTSSNKKIVTVDAETGRIQCLDTGVANITITAKGTKLIDVVKITVLDSERIAIVPARTTKDNAKEVRENLAKIDAIKASATNELTALRAAGVITENELAVRKAAIHSAFESYGITWSTPERVKYWNSALSATNDFRPDRMYYGMPYIQNGAKQDYTNRRFTLQKAVQSGYMKAVSGTSRVYTMTNKRLSDYYVGCDCSSFSSMAIWGTTHAASYLNTTLIASSNYYKTIPDKKTLRPGDLLNKSGSHVIMFLYYTDSAKSQMMLIEQGGNTVTCNVANLSKYASYTAKRPLKFGI